MVPPPGCNIPFCDLKRIKKLKKKEKKRQNLEEKNGQNKEKTKTLEPNDWVGGTFLG